MRWVLMKVCVDSSKRENISHPVNGAAGADIEVAEVEVDACSIVDVEVDACSTCEVDEDACSLVEVVEAPPPQAAITKPTSARPVSTRALMEATFLQALVPSLGAGP
jgi:hypothetical protein